MARMKKLYEESDDDALNEAIHSAYYEAETNPTKAIEILRDCYVKYQADNDKILAVANDSSAIQWLTDYWAFVRDTEHGNEPSIAEIDGFSGFAQIIAYPDIAEQTMEYLLYDDYDKIDDEARDLIDRLTNLTGVTMAKMKKSIDEDAVFDFIKDSNSCCYGEIYDYCKDIGMSDEQIDSAISNLKSEGKIAFVNQIDYIVKSSEKMKKSMSSIHDMIAQTRQNNNSLVKSRVDLDNISR